MLREEEEESDESGEDDLMKEDQNFLIEQAPLQLNDMNIEEDWREPFFKDLLKHEAEPCAKKSWKLLNNKPHCIVYGKKYKNQPFCMIKAFCDVFYRVPVIVQAICNEKIRKK